MSYDDGDDPSKLRDELPEDLDPRFAPPYQIPDNKRRRIPGVLYIVMGLATAGLVVARGGDGVLVNRGLLVASVALVIFGVYHLVAAVPLAIDENDALVVATREVGFPVGHASAQLGWRGLTSRPTWRTLIFSAEDPPARRGLVLVDGVDGTVVDTLVEDNIDE